MGGVVIGPAAAAGRGETRRRSSGAAGRPGLRGNSKHRQPVPPGGEDSGRPGDDPPARSEDAGSGATRRLIGRRAGRESCGVTCGVRRPVRRRMRAKGATPQGKPWKLHRRHSLKDVECGETRDPIVRLMGTTHSPGNLQIHRKWRRQSSGLWRLRAFAFVFFRRPPRLYCLAKLRM